MSLGSIHRSVYSCPNFLYFIHMKYDPFRNNILHLLWLERHSSGSPRTSRPKYGPYRTVKFIVYPRNMRTPHSGVHRYDSLHTFTIVPRFQSQHTVFVVSVTNRRHLPCRRCSLFHIARGTPRCTRPSYITDREVQQGLQIVYTGHWNPIEL